MTDKEKTALKDLLRGSRPVPSFNTASYQTSFDRLKASDPLEDKKKAQKIVDVFNDHSKKTGLSADEMGRANLPTRIRQSIINRIDARFMTQLWAIEMGEVNPADWSDQFAYRVHLNQLPKIYKIGAPGGNWHEIVFNRDSVVRLGDPVIYTSPEFLVPIFNPRYPNRYQQDLREVADFAGIALANQVDTDAMTAINAQIVLAASGDLLSAGTTFMHPKVYGAPTYNALDYSGSGNTQVTQTIYRNLALHVMKLNRRFERIWMHPDTIGTMWAQVQAGAGTGYFTDFPESYRERILANGESAWNNFFGVDIPTPTPSMAIDATGTEKYFWVLLSPTDPLAPRGCFWLFTYPDPTSFGENGNAYTGVDNLQYIRRQVGGDGRVFDVYVAQKAVHIIYTDYQRLNLVRVRYD